MKIEFDKEVVEFMMSQFGKEGAVRELTSACRVVIEAGIEDIEKELAENKKNG